MNIILQIDPQECVDCIQEGLNKNWGAFISCTVTIAVGAIIRHFEKKRLERKSKK